jgi:hypothetical protein
VLKVEFDDAEGFRSNYLSDLSEGGVRINTAMEVGQRILLNISFLGFLEPTQIEAVVQWSFGEDHSDGPASGLAFVDPSEDVQEWLADVLDFDTNLHVLPSLPSRVALLESQPFLREIYGQEVRNWAELGDNVPLELSAVDSPQEWMDTITAEPAMLGIVDVDELSVTAIDLYTQVRENSISMEMPLIVIGAPENIEPLLGKNDELLFVLRKPLRFGVLMNTVRVLARDPLTRMPALKRAGSKREY